MRKKPRLSEFIKEKLEARTIPGLEYIDRDKMVFRIPWKHGAKQGYQIETDGVIYVEWAKVTNKYSKYYNKPNVWKTNFRCAINSLPDVICLDDEQDKVNGKLRSDKEYRIFQFVSPDRKQTKERNCRNGFKVKSQKQNIDSSRSRKVKKTKKYKTQETRNVGQNINADLAPVKTESDSSEITHLNSIEEQLYDVSIATTDIHLQNSFSNMTPDWNDCNRALPTAFDGEIRFAHQDDNQDGTFSYHDNTATNETTTIEPLSSIPAYREILSYIRPSENSDDGYIPFDGYSPSEYNCSYHYPVCLQGHNASLCQSGY
ncbi:uncharacterized protein TRIADDRAFT_63874 [Trichoplax adhaerens]|uniref:IRF tryptophan pentad repeat domain-containing protein n=1 Tax=Trichoplax adhaerens TaxID=10228 RepID=B3RVR8_TRIAD|nr:hypothetical protein TRIADDRAFT_63874 [Trichoplax adhaerens]EDV25547.1 hypothetical protein TRIADDRAFT_63874 [Trichoplax adhaerens]|eukprot:XP_002111580.1 hypothetical protein TRIADDRAFT_63874 [Trichoplax adhaerens]